MLSVFAIQLEAAGYYNYFTYAAAASAVFPVSNYFFTYYANKDHNGHIQAINPDWTISTWTSQVSSFVVLAVDVAAVTL